MNSGPAIVSTAHEWAAALEGRKASEKTLVCIRCGTKASVANLPSGGCTPHHEFASSGWKEAR